MSSLASGADQIVVSNAMKLLGASSEVVLPFRPEDYRQDFDFLEDLQKFDELYEKADSVTNNPFVQEPAPIERSDGYRRAGETVVQSCEIIIAVWDGHQAHGPGGTAEMVEYALSLNRPVIWINVSEKKLPVTIVTSLKKRPGSEDFDVVTKPFPERAIELSPQFVQLLEYNRDPAFRLSGFARAYNDNLQKMDKARAESGLPEESTGDLLRIILSHYARADHLALRYQKIHIRSAIWLYRLASIAVIVAVVQALFAPLQTIWIIFEIVALLSALVLYRLEIIENRHEKWLNYRHLAERFRILIFSSLLKPGLSKKNAEKVRSLPFYQGPGEWVLKALSQVQESLPKPEGNDDRFQSVKKFILAGLIRDQAMYFAKTAREKLRHTKREKWFIGFLLAIILMASSVHLLNIVHDGIIEKLIVTLVVVLPAIAASQHAIGVIHDYERISSRSARMEEILNALGKAIEKTEKFEELSEELKNVEDIMSTENHEWCVSLSFRRISLPV